MKKAGLCVRYDCDNFGSMLQILATQKAIQQVGWNYEIIRYDKRTLLFYLTNVSRIFNPYFMKGKLTRIRKNREIKKYPEVFLGNGLRKQCIADYRKLYIGPYSPVYKGYRNLKSNASNYDAVVVGSDQLWTPAGIKSKFYNLLFVPNQIRKISFSTSFGVSNIPDSQKQMTAEYLKRMDSISVREIRGAEIVEELTGRKAKVTLDPTLLYSDVDWEQMFPKNKVVDDEYILAYFLGNNETHRDAVEELKKDTGYKIVTIPFMDMFVERDLKFGDEKLFEVGPVEFLNLIRGAKFICTDSFHGSVFSILYHKQFITFNRTNDSDKQTRNSRIDSLFKLLALESRRFNEHVSLYKQMNDTISYAEVDKRLLSLRNETFSFLKEALN